MKQLIYTTILLLISYCSFSQGRFQKLYSEVIKFSTAPNFIVVNVVDFKSNTSKQICISSSTFLSCLSIDKFPNDSIINEVRVKATVLDTIFTIELRDKRALEMIGFDKYDYGKSVKIAYKLDSGLIDSLISFISFRDTVLKNPKFDRWCELNPECKREMDNIYKEIERRNAKFFNEYYKKYGLRFCHALFLKGFTSYQDCENGQICLGRHVK